VLPEKPDNQNDQQVKTFPPGFIHWLCRNTAPFLKGDRISALKDMR
jgi:hypothetical protein